MHVGFDKHKNQKGSSAPFLEYLEKENQGLSEDEKDPLFSHSSDNVSTNEAITAIDNNIAKLGKNEEKYFTLHISPSDDEIKTINGDIGKFKEFVRDVMDKYAQNFNKGLTGNDLVYYAKIERTRRFKTYDIEAKNKMVRAGEAKAGDQLHAHVIVSRKDKTNRVKLSPKDNAKGGQQFKVPGKSEPISRGFNRNNFFNSTEEIFDKKFSYERNVEDTFEYKRLKEHHPVEFKKRYGADANKKVSITSLDNKFSKRVYTEKHVNKIVTPKNTKKQIDTYLKQRGITIEKKGAVIRGHTVSYSDMKLSQSAKDLISTYYLSKKLGKEIEGKEEKERE